MFIQLVMQINAKINVLGAVDKTAKAQKNLAYSTVQGINATAKQIQTAEQDNLAARFTLRTPNSERFLKRQVAIIRPFASVKNGVLYAEVSVGKNAKVLLPELEDGATLAPRGGKKAVASPVVGSAARPSRASATPTAFTMRSMALKAHKTAKRATQLKGRNRTFTIPGVGVFRRFGSSSKNIQMLYAFTKDRKVPARLEWERTARTVADRWLSENITRAFYRTLPRN